MKRIILALSTVVLSSAAFASEVVCTAKIENPLAVQGLRIISENINAFGSVVSGPNITTMDLSQSSVFLNTSTKTNIRYRVVKSKISKDNLYLKIEAILANSEQITGKQLASSNIKGTEGRLILEIAPDLVASVDCEKK